MATKHTTVYLAADGVVHVDPMNVTPAGVHVSAQRIRRLAQPPEAELGAAVLASIQEAGQRVPHPATQAEWSTGTRAWVKAMSRKSFRQVMRDFVAANLTATDGTISVEPTTNLGTSGGFQPLDHEPTLISTNSSPAEIGRAVQSALMASRPWSEGRASSDIRPR